ncbi:VCBS repeat-containing protein [soil metagenome]
MKTTTTTAAAFAALAAFVLATAGAADLPFQPETIDDSVEIGYGLALADVDGDGKTDIILADKREIRWYENPTWKPHVLARNLTLLDNVCVAARDVDGDGKAEIAVGAGWNPGETTDPEKSGAVFYLQRPEGDPRARWEPIPLPHDPTVHRMRWFKREADTFALGVLPLHGIGNQDGAGENDVQLSVFDFPIEAGDTPSERIATGLHATHNFDVVLAADGSEILLVAGAAGIRAFPSTTENQTEEAAGEVRYIDGTLATIEPMHGNRVVVHGAERKILDDTLNQGHGLAVADLLGRGQPQVIAGWRNPDASGKVGIKIYDPQSGETLVLDDNTMACEDLAVADLDDDGHLEVVAAGRSTHNLVIYWNRPTQ